MSPLNESGLCKTFSDYIIPNGDWDLRKLAQHLLDNLCGKIATICLDRRKDADDTMVQKHLKEVEFSVKSAYRAISKEDYLKSERFWNLI